MALSTGSLLAGRYEITAPVAVGGMGEVWRARDRVLGRTVAAKVLRSEYTGDPNFLARFRNEARHTAALSHPNIASVYDYGETLDEHDQTVAYLVMEFVEGQTLVQILHEEGRLPVDWTLHVLQQAAEGLSAAHRAGVVHRDIKPGNLIVRPDGVVKLTDFGIAQARDATPLTRTGMVVGTAQYLSPEQAQGMEVTSASDVYSLGVVAYECLAGVRPFDGASQVAIALAHINRPPPPLPPDVPPAVEAMIDRALAKDPADRFTDGGAFADAVRHVAAGGTLPGPVPATGGLASGTAPGAPTDVMHIPEDGTRVLSGAAAGALAAGPDSGTRARPMPPLRGTPHDDVDGYPEEDAPPPSRRWVWVAAVVALLLVAAVVGWLLLSGGDTPRTGPADTPTTTQRSTPAGTVFIGTNGFIGQPADQVQQQLQAQGLTVSLQDATTRQMRSLGRALAAGAVVGSDPANATVPKGSSVVLFVAPRAYAPPSHVTSAAPTTKAAPTTHAAPTTSATPTPTPSTSSPPASTSSSAATTTAQTTTSAPGTELTTSSAPSSSSPPPQAAGSGPGDGGVTP